MLANHVANERGSRGQLRLHIGHDERILPCLSNQNQSKVAFKVDLDREVSGDGQGLYTSLKAVADRLAPSPPNTQAAGFVYCMLGCM